MWIDSHCHLNHERIADLGAADEIIATAQASGTRGMLTVCCRIVEEGAALENLASQHKTVWCSVGTHPHEAGLTEEKAISSAEIVSRVKASSHVIAIGETGLDYFYENSPVSDQKESFYKHLEACVESDVPVIVHTRDADEDTAAILEEVYHSTGRRLRGVLHCFSSGADLARRALDIGFYISFSGILTFKRSDALREIAKTVPLDRVLVETDSPFLAPQAVRGQTNSPAYVGYVGEQLARLHEKPVTDMAQMTCDNFYRLFTKAQRI